MNKTMNGVRSIVVAITMLALIVTIIGVPVAVFLWQMETLINRVEQGNECKCKGACKK